MHVDQCLWSNVGKNFAGYKVMALWPFGHPSNEVLDDYWAKLFRPSNSLAESPRRSGPLPEEEVAALSSCVKMAVLQPGDVFFFSGACAHMAMCVGLPSAPLSVTAYESFINTNPRHVELFCKTNRAIHFFECHMRWGELRDMK